jgi:hypothetical protein
MITQIHEFEAKMRHVIQAFTWDPLYLKNETLVVSINDDPCKLFVLAELKTKQHLTRNIHTIGDKRIEIIVRIK